MEIWKETPHSILCFVCWWKPVCPNENTPLRVSTVSVGNALSVLLCLAFALTYVRDYTACNRCPWCNVLHRSDHTWIFPRARLCAIIFWYTKRLQWSGYKSCQISLFIIKLTSGFHNQPLSVKHIPSAEENLKFLITLILIISSKNLARAFLISLRFLSFFILHESEISDIFLNTYYITYNYNKYMLDQTDVES